MRRAAILLMLVWFVWPAVAQADSGTGAIYALPDSQELEGSVQITHECTGSPCSWFGEVSAYPVEVGLECPQVFDPSRGVWVSPVEEGPGTASGSFPFLPEVLGSASLCLYVHAGTGSDRLVGRVVSEADERPSTMPQSDVPILAGPWASDQEGYGHVRPSIIYNGGDALGRVKHIHWSSWGGAQAIGSGLATYVAPSQKSTAEGRLESARVVLFHLGYCHERRAYDAVEWYFPQHGQHFRPYTYIDSCTGQYR